MSRTPTLQKPLGLEDVTKAYFESATPNSHTVQDLHTFVAHGTTYVVDGKNVVIDYSPHEKEIAELLERELGGEIYMVPRINHPVGVSTPDYLFRGARFDLKRIFGGGKNTLYDAVAKKAAQSENYVFDITQCPLDEAEVKRQIALIYKSTHTKFVDVIMIVKNGTVSQIFKRKKQQS